MGINTYAQKDIDRRFAFVLDNSQPVIFLLVSPAFGLAVVAFFGRRDHCALRLAFFNRIFLSCSVLCSQRHSQNFQRLRRVICLLFRPAAGLHSLSPDIFENRRFVPPQFLRHGCDRHFTRLGYL